MSRVYYDAACKNEDCPFKGTVLEGDPLVCPNCGASLIEKPITLEKYKNRRVKNNTANTYSNSKEMETH